MKPEVAMCPNVRLLSASKDSCNVIRIVQTCCNVQMLRQKLLNWNYIPQYSFHEYGHNFQGLGVNLYLCLNIHIYTWLFM